MVNWRKRKPAPPAMPARDQPPPGWHDGSIAAVHIVRRQQDDRQAEGWDLIDTYSCQLIQEFYNDELTELFKSIYTLCYNQAIEALKLIGNATPEHLDSDTGTPVAMIRFAAFTTLPKSIEMTREEAMNTPPNKRKVDIHVNASHRLTNENALADAPF
jgi:hypothetical protein